MIPGDLRVSIEVPATQQPLRVLLAEDDPFQRKLLERVLVNVGYDVESVSDGAEALQKLLPGEFNILITDREMPSLDGLDLCRRIRAEQLPGYLYILMLTDHSTTDDLVAALGAGANDFVAKPAKMPELLARVNSGRQIVQLERSLKESNAQVQKLSVTDALTQTYNRRYLDEKLPEEIARSLRYDHTVSVVMLDIDHFKQVNDTHGHAVGDRVIRHVAELAIGATRHLVDWVARYGGEEFVLVLPETPLDAAVTVAEKIRRECESRPLTITSDRAPSVVIMVTASFGVAASRKISTDEQLLAAELLKEADALLYRSKREGRNRVTATAVSPEA